MPYPRRRKRNTATCPQCRAPLVKGRCVPCGYETRSKYKNVKSVVDGISFDSLAEVKAYEGLKRRKQSGEIIDFHRPAPTLMLDLNGFALGAYTPDFEVIEQSGRTLIEVKGRKDPAFRLRYLLAQVLYPQYRFEYVGEKEPALRRVPAKRSRRHYVTPS